MPVYRVVVLLLTNDLRPRVKVVATFDDRGRANGYAAFLRESGKYRAVEVETALGDPSGCAGSTRFVDESGTPAPSTASQDGLGEVLFERRKTLFRRVLVSLVLLPAALLSALAGTAIGLDSLGLRGTGREAMAPWWFALILLCGAGVLLVALWDYLRYSFRCHEFGLSTSGAFGTRSLRYDQLDHVTYSASQTLLFHVLPVAQNLTVKFTARSGEKPRRIVFRSDCFVDPDPEVLLGEIAEILEENSTTRIAYREGGHERRRNAPVTPHGPAAGDAPR